MSLVGRLAGNEFNEDKNIGWADGSTLPVNPCGAGYPSAGPISMNETEPSCSQNQFRGFCCDAHKRINDLSGYYIWEAGVNYHPYVTLNTLPIGTSTTSPKEWDQTAKGCGVHAAVYHHSYAGTGIGTGLQLSPLCAGNAGWNFSPPMPKGCESPWVGDNDCGNEPAMGAMGYWPGVYGVTNRGCWEAYWTQCKKTLFAGLQGGCTNPQSFGIVTFNDISTGMIGNSGSPSTQHPCKKNCMQLSENYYNIVSQGKSADIASTAAQSLIMGGFDRKQIYDCEPAMKNPPLQSDGITTTIASRIQGAKLIFAGFNGWRATYNNTTVNGYVFGTGCVDQPGNTCANFETPYGENTGLYTPTGNGWRGYLWRPTHPDDVWAGAQRLGTHWNNDNAWGQVDDSAWPPVLHTDNSGSPTKPHLWRRRSEWKTSSTGTHSQDFDSCCKYVSFGCTDSSFGSYDVDAELNCDGIPKTNVASALTQNTGFVCFDVNGNDVYGNAYDDPTAPNLCYDTPLQCSVCINTATQGYYDSSNIETYDAASQDYNAPCTEKIWKACGGSGYISHEAWTLQSSNRSMHHEGRPTSDLYGVGGFYNKGGQKWALAGGGWDSWTDNQKPLCSCTNAGCLDSRADNYNSNNILDCTGYDPIDLTNPIAAATGQPLSSLPNGDIRCCIKEFLACTDPTKDNYFCKIDINNTGTPDNAEYCMDDDPLSTIYGLPCWDGTSYICGSVPNGGVPLFNPTGLPFGSQTNNITVSVQDDATCDIVIQGGCMDNGTNASISPYGVSALNYDPNASQHSAAACKYAFVCTQPFASNFEETCDGLTYADLYLAYPDIVAGTINQYVVPWPQCCTFDVAGAGPGCMDPNAINFNPLATIPCPDDCCIYPIEGCTDPNAINFNIDAVIDDGSCIYSTDFPEEGTNFLDGTPIELCMDPLTKEEVLMNVCQPTEIQSEVFIERGTQTVFEPNQRLGEVNTIGGLEIYGYGFYNIKKQI